MLKLKLRELSRDVVINFGKWFFDTSENLAELLPSRARPKAKKFVREARDHARKALDKSSLTRVFLENLAYRSMTNGLSKAVMFFLTLWLTRVLSPRDFGLYSFTISTAMLFSMFGNLGVTGAMMRKLPYFLSRGEKEKASSWVLGSLVLLMIGSISVFALLFLTSPWLAVYVFNKPYTRGAIKLAGGFLFLMTLVGFFDSIFISLKRNDLSFLAGIAREIVKVIMIVALVVLGFSYVGAVYGYMISFLAFLLISVFILSVHRKYRSLIMGAPESIKEIFSYSKWFMALGLSSTVLSMTDVVMISVFMPIDFAGYYKIAVSLVSTIMFLIPVGLVTLPLLSESKDEDDLNKRFRGVFYPTVLATTVVAILLAVFGKLFLSILYPDTYVEHAWMPLSILAFLIPARNAFWLNSQRLIVLGKERKQLMITVSAAVLNVILNVLLIPWLGLVGAALASVLSLVVGGVAVCFVR